MHVWLDRRATYACPSSRDLLLLPGPWPCAHCPREVRDGAEHRTHKPFWPSSSKSLSFGVESVSSASEGEKKAKLRVLRKRQGEERRGVTRPTRPR